jgi:Xaa-Pro aminopeptidase
MLSFAHHYNIMKYLPISNALFVENRTRFSEKMKEKCLAIFVSNDQMPQSADQTFPFKQNPDLFYLTGIDQEETYLLLFPDAPNEKYREILFIRKTNDYLAVWEGEKFTKEKAAAVSGIKTVLWTDDFPNMFNMLMFQAKGCYLNLNEHDRASNNVPYHEFRFAKETQAKYPLHEYHRAAPLMHRLRAIKNNVEVELLQTACDITKKGFERVLKFVKGGVYEYEIEAEITHEFLRNRATGHAYHPIIASGKDSCILHYDKNNKICLDGEVLLMDFGAEYANYCADMTRTIPVNGLFTTRQKEVYNAVLRVMKDATQMLRPGNTIDELSKEVGRIVENELIGLGLLKSQDVKNQNPDAPLYKKYFMHGTSHFLGLDVHDVGCRQEPIKAGMVFTCEPGIYIREENIGIRLENDILVTDSEPFDLMKHIPIEAEEIEQIMNSK